MRETRFTSAVDSIGRMVMYGVVHTFIILPYKQVSCIPIRHTLADVKALKAIKATPREHRHEYQHQHSDANLASDDFERDSFFKVQSLAIIFKLCRIPRAELKKECIHLGIKWKELMYDMPVRWNSIDKMLKAVLYLEKPIQRVLLNQNWDESVCTNLTLIDTD
jgi:hypothetical protein